MGIDRERLRTLVKASGVSARSHSLAAGLGPTAIKDILSGKSRDPGIETIAKIAQQLGVALGALTDDGDAYAGQVVTRPMQIVSRPLPIRYRVQAGLWYEMDNSSHFDLRDDERQLYEGQGAIVPQGKYSPWPQWLEIISGDSINLRAPDGALAHVVDAVEMGYAPKDGDWVIVERRRDDGALRERTIKQVEIRDSAIRLMPRSSDPRWQTPVDYTAGARGPDGVEVQIVGKVIGFYSPA